MTTLKKDPSPGGPTTDGSTIYTDQHNKIVDRLGGETALTADKAISTDANGNLETQTTTKTELNYLTGLQSNVQASLNKKPETTSLLTIDPVATDIHKKNDHVFQNRSLVTFGNNQYCAYYNDSLQVVIGKRQISPTIGKWTFSTKTSETIANENDDHDQIELELDKNGIIYFAYGTHAEALKIRNLATAEDITSAVQTPTTPGTNESSVTYPIFWKDNNDEMYFVFRSGNASIGDMYMYALTAATKTFIAATGTGTGGIFINGTGNSLSPYVSRPFIDSANVAHFYGVFRSSAAISERNPFYVGYDATAGQFERADGTSQTVPVTTANQETIESVSTSKNLNGQIRALSTWKDTATGNIYAVYSRNDADNIINIFMAKYTGTWAVTQLTQFTSSANGTKPCLLVDSDDIFYVMFQQASLGYKQIVLESSDKGVTWSRPYTIGEATLTRSNYNIDYSYWNANNVLMMQFVHSYAFDNADAGTLATMGSRTLYIQSWDPKSGIRGTLYTSQSLQSVDDIFIKSGGKIFIESEIGSDVINSENLVVKCPHQTGISVSQAPGFVLKSTGNDGVLRLTNSGGTSTTFSPEIMAYPLGNTTRTFIIQSYILPAEDSGTQPAIRFKVAQSDDTDLIRPILDITNNGTLLTLLDSSGNWNFQSRDLENFILNFTNPLTPSQITSNQNNYNPTGMSTSSWLRLSTDASRDITGIAAPTKRKLLFISNIGSFNIVLKNESASSTAANRFALNADITIAPFQGVVIVYDVTQARWTAFGSTATGGLNNVVEDTTPTLGGPLNANGQTITNLPTPTLSSEPVPLGYFEGNTLLVEGATANYKVIARKSDNSGAEWILLTNNHLSGSAGITYANLQNVSATDRILGRYTAGAGVIEEITPASLRTMINVADGANNYSHPNHTGHVTSTGDGATVIDKTAITGQTQDRLPDLQKDRILTHDNSADGLKYVELVDVIINTLGFKRGSVGVASNNTRFSNGWLSFPSPSGTETFGIDASGRYLSYQPAVSTDSDGGLRATTVNTVRADSEPIIQFRIYVDNVANTRWFFGFQNSATAPTGDDPLASAHGVMFVKKAGTANLYIVANNAGTKSEVSVITTLANTTVYTIALRSRSAGTIWEYSIDGGAWTDIGATLPTATTGLCWFSHIEVDSAVTRNLRIYGIEGLSK